VFVLSSEETSPKGVRSRQAVIFGAVSIVTTIVDFALFNVLNRLGTSLLLANTIAYSAGIVASYLLNKHWTFDGGGRDKIHHEIGLFVLINIGGLWVNNFGVLLAARVFDDSTLVLNLAKLVAGAATWVLKYVTFKRWVYPAARS
jgi:putative flippase GtrA